jgi:hypothetical protein
MVCLHNSQLFKTDKENRTYFARQLTGEHTKSMGPAHSRVKR